jgi:hypothetical protein
VERINSFSFYDVGKTFKSIEMLPDNAAVNDVFWAIYHAENAAAQLLEGKPIPLGISRAKATNLRDQLANFFNGRFTEVNAEGKRTIKFPGADTPPVQPWEYWTIKHALTEFETVFAEEMKEAATYYVPRRGIFWTPALVDTADECFPQSIVGHIPQKTREDWKSAGRCLAFNLLSASGFHTARAVEGTMEAYYQLFTGQPGATLNAWFEYTEALKKVTSAPAPQAKTIAELDQMRTDYRNPIMHPRVVLTEPDARMLFANGESLIIAMAQEIADVKAQGGVQLALAGNVTKAAGSGAGQGVVANVANPANTP